MLAEAAVLLFQTRMRFVCHPHESISSPLALLMRHSEYKTMMEQTASRKEY